MTSVRKKPGSEPLAVLPELDLRVRDLVAACTRQRINLDYSKALNLFVELGSAWLGQSTQSERKKMRKVFGTHMSYRKFEKSKALAEWLELDKLSTI